MRLIDADALLDKTVKKNRAWKSITNSEGKDLEEIVSELPSINPREPKTGHWIIGKHGFKCSNCLIVHRYHSIHCPSCGAKMVEPQESEEV